LKHAHRQTSGRLVEHFGLVVDVKQVFGRFVVESLLTNLARRELVAQCVALPNGIEGLPVQAYHLLLGAADEIVMPPLSREVIESLGCGQDIRLQQPPEGIVRVVLAHVWRGREQ